MQRVAVPQSSMASSNSAEAARNETMAGMGARQWTGMVLEYGEVMHAAMAAAMQPAAAPTATPSAANYPGGLADEIVATLEKLHGLVEKGIYRKNSRPKGQLLKET